MIVSQLRPFIHGLFHVPEPGKAMVYIWQRNFLQFRRTWRVSLFWIALEPIVLLLGFGYGLGQLMGDIHGQSYAEFFSPAMVAISSMMVSFLESSYGAFTKLNRQKTYQTMLLSPLEGSELVLGEILWGASKGLLSGVIVLFVSIVLGAISAQWIIPALLIMALISWTFSALGLLVGSLARNYDWFIYAQSGILIPMALLSGTYFPLSILPSWFEKITLLLPLSHGLIALRFILKGELTPFLFVSLGVLVAFAFFATNCAWTQMRRRLNA